MGFKKIVLVCSSLIFALSLNACTSSQTEDTAAGAEVTDESLEMAEAVDNNADLSTESTEGVDSLDGGGDAFADLGESTPTDGTEAPADSTQSEMALDDTTVTEDTSVAETTESAPVDELAPDFGAPSDETALAEGGTEEATPDFGGTEESTETADSTGTPAPSYEEPAAPVGAVGLKKAISVPYMHAGKPVNGIYIARDGDTIESISQKIFGGNRVKELCSINATNCGHGIKVGDKYYYNSPQRPTDTENVKTFYEDAGVPAQTYVTQSGDNIRTLGKTLLGHERSWMELWALNPDVESKGELAEGVSLRYWPTSTAEMPTLAKTGTPAAPPVSEPEMPAAPTETPAEDMAMNDMPPPPPTESAPSDDFNSAESMPSDPAAMGSVEPPPPPPPPPPVDTPPATNMAADTSVEDPDQTMALGVGAILLLAGVALFIAIRKRKSRRTVDFNTTTQTQID